MNFYGMDLPVNAAVAAPNPTFQSQYGLAYTSKVISGYNWIPKLFLDLNHIIHEAIKPSFGLLTIFVTVQVLFRSSMTLTSRAKLFGLMVRPWKQFQTLPLLVMGAIQLPSAPPTSHLGDLLVGLQIQKFHISLQQIFGGGVPSLMV